MSKHISHYLDFQVSPTSNRKTYDNTDIAKLPSGSTIKRNQTRKGLNFQLFLNESEYNRIKNAKLEGRMEFYGGYYIYLPPASHVILDVCELFGWVNTSEETIQRSN